jgi:hypothetical protein
VPLPMASSPGMTVRRIAGLASPGEFLLAVEYPGGFRAAASDATSWAPAHSRAWPVLLLPGQSPACHPVLRILEKPFTVGADCSVRILQLHSSQDQSEGQIERQIALLWNACDSPECNARRTALWAGCRCDSRRWRPRIGGALRRYSLPDSANGRRAQSAFRIRPGGPGLTPVLRSVNAKWPCDRR